MSTRWGRREHHSVVKLDPAGAVVYRFTLPAARPRRLPPSDRMEAPTSPGSSDSLSNWQTTPGAWVPTSAGGYGNVFVIKLSPAGDRFVYATLLDNCKPGYPTATYAQAIAVDAQGSAYVTGTTKNPNFPITPGAYQAACGCATAPAVFVSKLSPDGSALPYSTLLESGESQPMYGQVLPVAIAIDPAGNVEVLSSPRPGPPSTVEIRRLSPDWTQLVSLASTSFPYATVRSATLDPQGNVLMTGTTAGEFVSTAGAFRGSDNGVVVAISKSYPATVTLSHSPGLPAGGPWWVTITGAGGSGWSAVNRTFPCAFAIPNTCSILVDTTGFGNLSGPVHYSISGFASFFAVARPDDGALLYSSALPYSVGGAAIAGDVNSGLVVLGWTPAPAQFGAVTRFVPDTASRPGILGIADSAAFNLSTTIAPGEALTLYGLNLRPPTAVSAAFDAHGRLPFALARTSVDFNGIPAPLLSVSDQQITVAAPFELRAGDLAGIRVSVNGQVSNVPQLQIDAAEPHFFTLPGASESAVVLNEDGSIDSGDHPAPGGSIVTVFVNGVGLITPFPQDGSAGQVGQAPVLPISVSYNIEYDIRYGRPPTPLELLYAGSRPWGAGRRAASQFSNASAPDTPHNSVTHQCGRPGDHCQCGVHAALSRRGRQRTPTIGSEAATIETWGGLRPRHPSNPVSCEVCRSSFWSRRSQPD